MNTILKIVLAAIPAVSAAEPNPPTWNTDGVKLFMPTTNATEIAAN